MIGIKDSILWHLTLAVVAAWAIGMISLWFIVPDIIASNVVRNVEISATNTIDQIKKFRNYYTRNVVRKVLSDGILTPSANHRNEKNSIPLPATLVHDLGRLTEKDDISITLYSTYPFPNRKDRVLDKFQLEAWNFLVKNPDSVFTRMEFRDNQQIARVAVADRLVANACVNCHNNHKESPRSDWKLGDVRGVIEVDAKIAAQLAGGTALSNTIMFWVSAAAMAILIVILWTTRTVSRPLLSLTGILGAVSRGDSEIEVPRQNRRDEIGLLAQGIQEFKNNVIANRRRQIEVLEAKEAAESANTAKTTFLASASHDLRQPLQALQLFVGALERTENEDQRRNILDQLKSSLDVLGTTLNTLLDLSNLETGILKPEPQQIEVSKLFELTKHYAVVAADKGLDFRVVGSTAIVISDPGILDSILQNFVSNAIKFTETGKVLVGCRRRGEHLRIEVWDTGLGIANTDIESIFDEYFQVTNSARERSKGLGLGLSIVKRSAVLLGHHIEAKSEPGKGSKFSIEVPLQ